MSKLKTYVFLLSLVVTPVNAFTNTADQQLQFFATCAGRLSALMEHQWTHDTASVDQTTSQRSEMINLVQAVMPAESGRDVLLLRVAAKHAQANLLRRAVVNKDPADAAWALSRAQALMTECSSVLLH